MLGLCQKGIATRMNEHQFLEVFVTDSQGFLATCEGINPEQIEEGTAVEGYITDSSLFVITSLSLNK